MSSIKPEKAYKTNEYKNQGVDMDPCLASIDGQKNAMNHSNVDIHRTLLALLVFQDQLKPDNMRSIHVYNNSRIYDYANESNHEKTSCLNAQGSNEESSYGFLRIQQDFLLQGLLSSGHSNNNNTEMFPVLLQLSHICSSSSSSGASSSPPFDVSPTDGSGRQTDSLVTLGQSLSQHVAILRHVQEAEGEEEEQYHEDLAFNGQPCRTRWRCVLQYCSDAPSQTSVNLPSLLPSQNPALRNCPSLAKDLQLVENIVNSLMKSIKYEDNKVSSESGNDPGYNNGQGYSGETNNINIHGLMQSGGTNDGYSERSYINGTNEDEESLIHIPFDVGSGEIGLDEFLASGGGEDEQSFQCFLDQNIWQAMEIPRSSSVNMTEDQRFNTWKSYQLKHIVLPSYSGPLNPDQTSIISSSLDDQILPNPSWDYPSLPMMNCQIVPSYLQEDPLLHPQDNTNLHGITQKGNKYANEPCSSIFNDYEPAQDFSTVASSQRSPFDFDLLLDKTDFDSYFPLESDPGGISGFYGGTNLGGELEMEAGMSVFSDESIGTGAPRMMPPLSEPPLTIFGLGREVNGNGSHSTVSNEAYVEHDQWSARGRQETRSCRVNSASATASKRNVDAHRSHRGSSERMTEITLTELSQYFNMPITQASKELKVGLTVLKKRCREFGIPRWPHRKMKSLDSLIHNIQDLAKSNGGKPSARVLNAVRELEEQKKKMEEMPGIELAERTKRLRQACFKASYKKRRQISQSFVIPDHSHDHMSSSVSSSSDLNCTSSSSYMCQ